MPDIAFHFSSETADSNGHCPGGNRTRIHMPIEPALQIPNTAKPVCWLHNLAFNNSIANVSASDGSDSLVLGTGDGAVAFQTGATNNPWIGFRYKAPDGTQCGIVAPLTTAHGLATGDEAPDMTYTGLQSSLNGHTLAQVYGAINVAFQTALNSPAYANKSLQNKVGQLSPGAAVLDNGKVKTVVCPLPGSTIYGILKYNGAVPDDQSVTINAAPLGYVVGKDDTLTTALNTSEFQLMTSAQINATISHVIFDGNMDAAYTTAVSIFETLGGGPMTPDAGVTSPTWLDRNNFGGTQTLVATGFGLHADATTNMSVSIPIACYGLPGMERAIARQAKADTTFWTAVNSHQPHGMTLADPDLDAEWNAATNDASLDASGTVYTRIVQLIGNTEQNRAILQCAPQVQIVSGALLTTVLGFDAVQLGNGTEGAIITSTAPNGNQTVANNAARVDRSRCVVFHAPTLAAGSFSTSGKKGGSALAMIPITADVGDVQAWEASVPIKIPSAIAGSSLSHLTVYLSNEDLEPLNLLSDRWSAQMILSF
jgi:hypothetical protein